MYQSEEHLEHLRKIERLIEKLNRVTDELKTALKSVGKDIIEQ